MKFSKSTFILAALLLFASIPILGKIYLLKGNTIVAIYDMTEVDGITFKRNSNPSAGEILFEKLSLNIDLKKESSKLAAIDSMEVLSVLDAPTIDSCRVIAYDAEGNIATHTSKEKGYWFSLDGSVVNYRTQDGTAEYWKGCTWEIYYTTSENTAGWVVNTNFGVEACHGSVKIGFEYKGRVLMYDINIEVVAPEKFVEDYISDIPNFMRSVFIVPGDRHWDFGYPSIMKIRDVFTNDIAHVTSGYFHFSHWQNNTNQGEDKIFCQGTWLYYMKQIAKANIAIIHCNSSNQIGYAYAFRAFSYLEMAQMYEFLPTDVTTGDESGNNVINLTVPVVTESMSEEKVANNPRLHRNEMLSFILSDLDKAERHLSKLTRTNKELPDLAVVYGLKARAYMWVEDYANAQVYARKAIDTFGGKPTSKEEWLSTTNGFNDLTCPSWMWGGQYTSQDDAVHTSIINWTSWASNELIGGYLSAGPYMMIDAKLYNQIDDRDFRKLSYVAPKGGALAGQEVFINKDALMSNPYFLVKIASTPYSSLKFRPGQGEMYDYSVACACAYPLMRVEEMYLIEAEAAAHLDASQGKIYIENFMRTYRFAEYKCNGVNKKDIVDEIFKQKRIELWGEGLIFFDYKRLNKPVTRSYTGSNHSQEGAFNTSSRPAWMNIVIVSTAVKANKALEGWNNPNPSDLYETQPIE